MTTRPIPPPVTVPVGAANFHIADGASGLVFDTPGAPYIGPLPITSEYIEINQTNLMITAKTPSVYINSGNGDDTVTAFAGRNYLDGAAGNNVLIGATGIDSFEVAADPTGSVTDVIKNFHAGDDILFTGLTANDFTVATSTVGGALQITATSLRPDGPTATLHILGYTAADVASDRIAVTFSDRGMIVLGHG